MVFSRAGHRVFLERRGRGSREESFSLQDLHQNYNQPRLAQVSLGPEVSRRRRYHTFRFARKDCSSRLVREGLEFPRTAGTIVQDIAEAPQIPSKTRP